MADGARKARQKRKEDGGGGERRGGGRGGEKRKGVEEKKVGKKEDMKVRLESTVSQRTEALHFFR